MDNRKKITKSNNVTRQITEIKRSAEYMEKVISIPSVFKGLDKHLERMASIPSVFKGLDKHLERMASIPSVSKGLDKHLERMASIPSVSKGLDKHLERMASIPSVSKGLDRHLERMASIPSVSKGFDKHLERMASIPSVSKGLDKHLERMASIPSVSKGLDKHLERMASIPSVSKGLDKHLERMASIPSVSKGLDKHLERMASIPSVSKGLDKHLERMASIPSVSKGFDKYMRQIASAALTLDILPKLNILSPPVRAMTEANISILAMREDIFLDSMSMTRSLLQNRQGIQEIMKSLSVPLDTSAMLPASLAAQSKLFELQRFPLGAAINAAASLQDSLSRNLDRFTANYRRLVDFTDHQPSIIEVLEPDIIQYPSHEVFREAELLEQITVPEDEQVIPDEYEDIAIPEERTLEELLWEINPYLLDLLQGARQALNTDSPDRARHVTVSLRELVRDVLDRVAPDDSIRDWTNNPCHYHEGRPNRRARGLYINREIYSGPLSKCVNADVDSVLTWFQALNAETHVIPPRLTDRELWVLIFRIELDLLFWLRLNSTNN